MSLRFPPVLVLAVAIALVTGCSSQVGGSSAIAGAEAARAAAKISSAMAAALSPATDAPTAGDATETPVEQSSDSSGDAGNIGGTGQTGAVPGTGPGLGGFSGSCLAVASAYATVAMAMIPSLTQGGGTFDAGQLKSAIAGVQGEVPAELQSSFDTLGAAGKAAANRSLIDAGQILDQPDVTKASETISAWVDKNCAG